MYCNNWECPHNKDGKCTWNDPNKDAPCVEEIYKNLSKIEEIFKKPIDK